MKRAIFSGIVLLTVSIATGFIISRATPIMAVKMHARDLPEHGLTAYSSKTAPLLGQIVLVFWDLRINSTPTLILLNKQGLVIYSRKANPAT